MSTRSKPLVLRLPTKVGNETALVTTKFGPLTSAPKVVDGVLYAGKVILVKRGWQGGYFNGANNLINGNTMEVHHEDDWARYELLPDRLVWSDGPPHPTDLQLAIRRGVTDGVKEPEVP